MMAERRIEAVRNRASWNYVLAKGEGLKCKDESENPEIIPGMLWTVSSGLEFSVQMSSVLPGEHFAHP
jgi:hypothetical protein